MQTPDKISEYTCSFGFQRLRASEFVILSFNFLSIAHSSLLFPHPVRRRFWPAAGVQNLGLIASSRTVNP